MFEQAFKNIDDILHKDAGCSRGSGTVLWLAIYYASMSYGMTIVGRIKKLVL